MQNTTMLYKAPGPHDIHGGKFDYTVVDESEIDDALAEGWALTTAEAKEAHEAKLLQAEVAHKPPAASVADDNAPPTRVELEAKATELGIEFSPRIGDAKLAERIDAALAGN